MGHFIEKVGQIIPETMPGKEAALKQAKSYMTSRKLHKNELVLHAGAICKKITYVREGCLYMYKDTGEKEEVIEFYLEDMLTSDYVSFIRQEPSVNYIKALEDTEVEEISYEDLHLLYDTEPPIERVGRLITESLYCGIITRMLSYQNDSPEVRYQKLIRQRPALLQRVPQYLIASFLGVTPVGLSKIRKRLHDNG